MSKALHSVSDGGAAKPTQQLKMESIHKRNKTNLERGPGQAKKETKKTVRKGAIRSSPDIR